jgi:phycoerythrin-associated linker protein
LAARCTSQKHFPEIGWHAAARGCAGSPLTLSSPRQVVAIVKTEGDRVGKVLRSIGYTEEIPAAGDWELKDDGSFYMKTIYTGTGAEETFWFATPDLRMRVSTIKSKGGKGVTTATFTTELRQKS